jgi:hypothetical protein
MIFCREAPHFSGRAAAENFGFTLLIAEVVSFRKIVERVGEIQKLRLLARRFRFDAAYGVAFGIVSSATARTPRWGMAMYGRGDARGALGYRCG